MPTAGNLAEKLDMTCQVSRDTFGRAVAGSAEAFVEAWLDAAVYMHAATISSSIR